jgi:4-amino-4-deoxy-L-arabinose transferase-like glycosyltransferase
MRAVSRRASLLIVALAVALRLAWVLLVPTRPVGDFAMYLESAAHLVAHHALDSDFIYMPGYVLLVAALQALGGGLLAAKMLGVAAGGLGAWAVFEIADRLWGRGTAVAAGLLLAVWPAGVAVSSVTGTDMPAAALLAAAVAVLVRQEARGRPWRAAIGFGVMLGLASYVRAVALPLALLAFPYWIAGAPTRAGLKAAIARTALGCGVAAMVLLPWGIRNQLRYGEFFITDSHGGHTALVGSNPDTEGVYSRSLNQMFWLGTGYRLFDPKPRDADRAAYALAKSWARVEPAYAVGLVAAKADRLLTNERPLLYWPLYRESVLRDPPRAFFDRYRTGIERIVDGFWYLLSAAALAGLVVAVARRQWRALALVPFPLALIALYATFFSEVRYHLAIAIFMFPYAAAALAWAAKLRPDRARLREALAVAVAVAALLLGWPALIRAGAGLRDRHRWAVAVCRDGGKTMLCNWRATDRGGAASSPVRGVWNGVGLRLPPPAGSESSAVAAATELDLPSGRYRITARADRLPPAAARLRLESEDQTIATAEWTAGNPVDAVRNLEGVVDHGAGKLRLELRAEASPPDEARATAVWLSDIRIERDLR